MAVLGIAHSAICVPDVDAAVAWYRDVLGLKVLSPVFRMEGDAIERDMSALVPSPVVVKAAILGGVDGGDRVLEVIEYPSATGSDRHAAMNVYDHGLTHVGLVCDDIVATREHLEANGIEFLVDGYANIANLRTTWFRDPFGVVFILLEKSDAAKPYYRQY
jgi:catechol 2,3-dioxygenase-like lactoylglutathione lyase family enzyme